MKKIATDLTEMAKGVRKQTSLSFWLCLVTSICLFVASFLVPPRGVIDPSILKAVAFLFGFAALTTLREAVQEGLGAKLTHGDTSIELTNKDEKDHE